jgi:hypothetical protein
VTPRAQRHAKPEGTWGHDQQASEAGSPWGAERGACATGQGGQRFGLASRPPALDELMRKLLVVHRLLEAEERLAKREPPTEPT